MIHTFEVETKQKCEYNKADGGFIMKNISAAIIFGFRSCIFL